MYGKGQSAVVSIHCINKVGNGKPPLNSNSCLEDPLLDLQESEQTRRTTAAINKIFVYANSSSVNHETFLTDGCKPT